MTLEIVDGEALSSVRSKLNAALDSIDHVYESIADLVASTESHAESRVVMVRFEDARYRVAPAGATDHHITTAGGLKLYVLPATDGVFYAHHFGGAYDGVTDDTATLQMALDTAAGGTLRLPARVTMLIFGVRIYSNTVLDLNGARLLKRPVNVGVDPEGLAAWTGYAAYFGTKGFPPHIFLEGGNIAVKNGIIDGNFANENRVYHDYGGSYDGNADRAGILGHVRDVPALEHITLQGLRFQNMLGPAINISAGGTTTLRDIVERDGYNIFGDMSGLTTTGAATGSHLALDNVRMHGTREYNRAPNCYVFTAYDTVTMRDCYIDGDNKLPSLEEGNYPDSGKMQSTNHVYVKNTVFLTSGVKRAGNDGKTFVVDGCEFRTSDPAVGNSGLNGGGPTFDIAQVTGCQFLNTACSLESQGGNVVISNNRFLFNAPSHPYAGQTRLTSPVPAININATLGGGGQQIVRDNLIDCGGITEHVAVRAGEIDSLEISRNTITGADHVFLHTVGSEDANSRLVFADNSMVGNRSLGMIRLNDAAAIKLVRNTITKVDPTAPSVLNGYSERVRINLSSGSGVISALRIVGNCFAADVDYDFSLLCGNGVRIERFELIDNTFAMSKLSNTFIQQGNAVFDSMVILANTLEGHLAFASGATKTKVRHALTTFTGSGQVYNLGVVPAEFVGSTQSTVGVAGSAAVLPSNPEGYARVTIGQVVYAMPYYKAGA